MENDPNMSAQEEARLREPRPDPPDKEMCTHCDEMIYPDQVRKCIICGHGGCVNCLKDIGSSKWVCAEYCEELLTGE